MKQRHNQEIIKHKNIDAVSGRDPAVFVENLVKEYPISRKFSQVFRGEPKATYRALDGINFYVEQGVVFGLLGPNGAGKTTLINILTTLLTPTSGTVKVGGYDLSRYPSKARELVGLVTSNERSFFWRLTGRHNLRFFADLYGVLPPRRDDWIDELILALELQPFADKRFDSYSTGVRQRFAFARSLLHNPKLLFMDEPTKGLDPQASVHLLEMIQKNIIENWGPTIILVSHNLNDIEALCKRVAIIDKGRLIACDYINKLRSNVQTFETYRLTLPTIAKSFLPEFQKIPGICNTRFSKDEKGNFLLEVDVIPGGEVLSELLGAVLGSGVRIMACTEVPVSLGDVFRQAISKTEGELPCFA